MVDIEILQDYSVEARELLEEMDASLMRLEKEGGSPDLLNDLFRSVHCIKGSAEYIGLEHSSSLTHRLETLLDRLREGVIQLDRPIVELLFRSKDRLSKLIEEVAKDHAETSDIVDLMNELEGFLGPAPRPPAVQAPEPPPTSVADPGEEEAEAPEPEPGPVAPPPEPTGVIATETTTTTGEELIAGSTLEETVPHVLSVSLYLDDLEDGVSMDMVRPALLETIVNIARSLEYIGISEGVEKLDQMRTQLEALPGGEGRVPFHDIRDLRSFLRSVQDQYPPETFPLEEPTLPEPEPSPVDETPREKLALAEALKDVPGISRQLIDAIFQAGFFSLEDLVRADAVTLNTIPGVTPSIANAILKVAQAPPPAPTRQPAPPKTDPAKEKSLLADVDDELLSEFEGIFGDEILLEEVATPVEAPRAESAMEADLLQDLEEVAEETDAELVEIFVSYGWEIIDRIKPVVGKLREGRAEGEDLERCAESIKAVRSSSAYMDYQKLASFLDEWYERTAWASTRMNTLGPEDLAFMGQCTRRFEEFLKRLDATVRKRVAASRVQPAREEEIEAQLPGEMLAPKEIPAPPPPSQPPLEKPAAAAPPDKPPRQPEARPIPQAAAPPEVRPSASSAGPPTPEKVAPIEAAAPRRAPAEGDPGAEPPQVGPVVRTMRVDAIKVDTLLNQVGELVVNRSYVEQLSTQLRNLQRDLAAVGQLGKKELQAVKSINLKIAEASVSLGRVASDLQEGVMKLRMLPVGQLFNRMPRLVRDLSNRVGKSVNLEVQGGDTEVDKRVIEQIYNPMVHMVRNAVDHGIEDPETRKRLGKNPEGTIRLNAYSQGSQVIIEVEDDGKGIDSDAVLRKAVESRLVGPEEARGLGVEEIYSFLFVPGFSTSKRVTRTSGRGVGMDVVKKDVEKINGQIELESWKDEGTRITIKIPLTLAIIQTLLIRAGTHIFAIPLVAVREIIQIAPEEISTIEGFEVIKFREETIAILR
ncbi:MAG: ATP-binding protein, partial [Thermodesulfobacteriota bacterium]